MLTLRDLQSSKTHAVPPGGTVIGREGGDADLAVRTASVSKKHARVFAAEGEWFLEDLRSANGTFVDNEKISEPFPLKLGLVFDLAGYRFEVASIVPDPPEPEDEEPEPDDANRTYTGATPEPPAPVPAPPAAVTTASRAIPRLGPNGRPPPRLVPGKPAAKPAAGNPSAKVTAAMATFDDDGNEADEEPRAETQAAAAPVLAAAAAAAESDADAEEPTSSALASAETAGNAPLPDVAALPTVAAAPAAEAPEVTHAAPSAASGVLADLPRAIAHYIVAVPKLLFMPRSAILKSVEEQPFPGIEGLPLVAWAIPGLATTFAVSLVCGLVAALVNVLRGGAFEFGPLLGAILLFAIGPIVGGLVTAFAYHPVTAFLIKLFKGESDARSRTNALIFFQGVVVLFAVPSGVAILLGALAFVPVVGGFLPLVSIALQLAVIPIAVGASYVWLKFFKVHSLVPKLVLVLGGLGALATLVASMGVIKAAVSGAPATLATATVKVADDDEAPTEAKPLSPEIKKQVEAAKAGAEAKVAAAAPAGDEGEKVDAKEPAEPAPKAAKEPAAEPEPKPVAANTPSPAAEANAAASGEATPYERWAQKRAFVEKAIERDPTLVKDAGLYKLYKQLHDKQRDIRKKIGGRAGIKADDTPALRLVEAESFSQTGALVDELYARLHK